MGEDRTLTPASSRRAARAADAERSPHNRGSAVIHVTAGLIVILALFVTPLAATAQEAKLYRIGLLSSANPRSAAFFQAFEQRLRELGYIDGQNVAIEFRNAEGRLDRLPGLAAELVRLNVNVILTATDHATRAVKEATTTIPIIIVGVNFDPVALKFVTSLARPGTNVTGLFFRHLDLTAKRFEVFKKTLPTVKRVAVFSDLFTADQLRKVEEANRSIGVKLQPLKLQNPLNLEDAFRVIMRSRAEALFVLESALIFRARREIAELALKNRLPTSFAFREYVDAGGLESYGVSFSNMFRRAAEYVGKILKGTDPGDLPVEQPTKFELVINMRTAKALGLAIPSTLVLRADQLIE
jgi:putative ABC transport system substrate-binding protein